MTTGKAIRIHEFGAPLEQVRVEDIEAPDPGAGEVLIEMLAAPINPADINLIEGTYGVRPELPAVVGNEGVGIVKKAGGGVPLAEGTMVKPPEGFGAWRQYGTAKAEDCVPYPEGLPAEQAAMLYVNPPTAWRMLHDYVDLQPGDWVIQNASNSGVGQSVIQICKAKGIHTLNLVRREELVDELKAIGADIVMIDDDSFREKWKEVKAQAGKIRLGLNAVGGDSAIRIMSALEKGGSHVTYGAMSKQPVKIPNKFLIFSDLEFRGFWMTPWYRKASIQDRATMLAEIGALMREGKLSMKVEKTFPLTGIKSALERAMQGSRGGKVLLDLKG